MNASDLRTMYDYGYWANARYFSVMVALPPTQFTARVGGSYGSVRDTLVHMMSAEWGWLDRCGGPARGAPLDPKDYPTLQSVTERWQDIERNVRAFLDDLRDEDLDRVVEFSIGGGPKHVAKLGDLLRHAANHGVHHRGQLGLMLRMLDVAPGNVDYLFYLDEH